MATKINKIKGYTNKKLLVCLFNITFISPYLLLCGLYLLCKFICDRLDDSAYYFISPLRQKMYQWAWYKRNNDDLGK